jgi:hypothetical protein
VEVPPDVELSGSESFRGLVLPLVKALGHFYKQEKPPATAMYFDAHLVFAVAVVDAPMIAVTIDEGKQKLTAVPWVRILRNESMDSDDWTERSKRYAIDVVHKDFLQPFLKNHLEPYAAKFGELALKHQLEIASGKAFAENMWHGHIAPLESRLKPRMTTHAVRRPMQILSHAIRQIGRLIMGKKLH